MIDFLFDYIKQVRSMSVDLVTLNSQMTPQTTPLVTPLGNGNGNGPPESPPVEETTVTISEEAQSLLAQEAELLGNGNGNGPPQ